MKTIISLCDLTGNMVAPWIDAGYQAVLVDPQHGETRQEGPVLKFAGTVEDALPLIGELIRDGDVAAVFGFPPCTDMAVSGARWFKTKYEADKLFQAKAVMVAEQCRSVGRMSGAPWFVENPVSVLASAFGKPQHTFHPADYTAYEPGDNYSKKTCLWAGGGLCDAAASQGRIPRRTRRPHPQSATRTRARQLPIRHPHGIRPGCVRRQRKPPATGERSMIWITCRDCRGHGCDECMGEGGVEHE